MCAGQHTTNCFFASFSMSPIDYKENDHGQGKARNEGRQEAGSLDPQGKEGGQASKEAGESGASPADSSINH